MKETNKNINLLTSFYPEVGISGYSSVDGTVEFYNRINSLLNESMIVLDFGAGRGAWFEDQSSTYKKNIHMMKGRVRKVVGCDVDDAIYENVSVDEKVKIEPADALPFEDQAFDVIISDYTFEHIADPVIVSRELDRILKKGGWLCARTPNKYSYISMLTRLVKNKYHSRILKYVQPDRKEVDVFPTTFHLNTIKDILKYFPEEEYDNFTYRYDAEPAYHFNRKSVFLVMMLINKILPSVFKSNLFIFLRKKK